VSQSLHPLTTGNGIIHGLTNSDHEHLTSPFTSSSYNDGADSAGPWAGLGIEPFTPFPDNHNNVDAFSTYHSFNTNAIDELINDYEQHLEMPAYATEDIIPNLADYAKLPNHNPVASDLVNGSEAVVPASEDRHTCTYQDCSVTFRRKGDRDRHVRVKHLQARRYFCQVIGCPKGFGKGYTRFDKLQEHMKRKHANAGFGNGVLGAADAA
jgi:hypothetical protein